MGNLYSVLSAFQMLGADAHLVETPDRLFAMDRLVLPGVGAFRDCMRRLREGGFAPALSQAVREQGRPLLGICLGMQALARKSYEGGEHEGLGWIDAEVVRLEHARVPHVGWNDLLYRTDSPIFQGLPARPDFYFVHSYQMRCTEGAVVDATCDYGGTVTAAVRQGNVVATQFHPEKSQDYGLRLLQNFLAWSPCSNAA